MKHINIIDQLTDIVNAHKDSLENLRERIAKLLEPIPVGTVLKDDHGEVCRIIKVCTGASQWSNRQWDVTLVGKAALTPNGKLLCERVADSFFDGNNLHYRTSAPTCLYDPGEPNNAGDALSCESGKVTREIAARLPTSIARFMGECAAETSENNETQINQEDTALI